MRGGGKGNLRERETMRKVKTVGRQRFFLEGCMVTQYTFTEWGLKTRVWTQDTQRDALAKWYNLYQGACRNVAYGHRN